MRIPRDTPDVAAIMADPENMQTIAGYLQRDDVLAFIASVNRRYLTWEEVRYRRLPSDTEPELLWVLIKQMRRNGYHTILLLEAERFTFRYSLSETLVDKLHEFDLKLRATNGSARDDPAFPIPQQQRNRYLTSSIMEEAIASSRLEGASTTRKAAKQMLRSNRKPRNKSEQMIVNNYRSMQRILELVDVDLTPALILDIHASMTAETLEYRDLEGAYRQSDDIAVVDTLSGDIFYHPPDHRLTSVLMEELCVLANSTGDGIHPIIKAMLLHFLVGYIHPFVDGNGRTARALFYWYLVKSGYRLIEFMAISRFIVNAPAQYARAYLNTEKDENDVTFFILYQIKSLDQALNDLVAYIERTTKNEQTLPSAPGIAIAGLNERQVAIIGMFRDEPDKTMSVKEVQNTFAVVNQTARTDLLDLVGQGFLIMERSGKRKMLFTRSERFEKLIAGNNVRKP